MRLVPLLLSLSARAEPPAAPAAPAAPATPAPPGLPELQLSSPVEADCDKLPEQVTAESTSIVVLTLEQGRVQTARLVQHYVPAELRCRLDALVGAQVADPPTGLTGPDDTVWYMVHSWPALVVQPAPAPPAPRAPPAAD